MKAHYGKMRYVLCQYDWSHVSRLQAISKAVRNICEYIPQKLRGTAGRSKIRRAALCPNPETIVPKAVQDLQEKRAVLFPSRETTRDKNAAGGAQNELHVSQHHELHPGESLSSLYEVTVFYEEQQELNKIRLRLLCVAFYRLKQAVEPISQARNYNTAYYLAEAIRKSKPDVDNIDVIHRRVRAWVQKGERYELIAEDLGGIGVLYILPERGGESL